MRVGKRTGRLAPQHRLLAFALCLAAGQGFAASAVDEPVGSRAQDRQRAAYEAFQRNQAQRYEQFQEDRQADYEAFTEERRRAYERFTGIAAEAAEEELDRLGARWEDPELSSQKVWVEYSEDLAERRRVDFEAGTISFESRGGDLEATETDPLRAKLRALLLEDRRQAFARDSVAQTIERRGQASLDDFVRGEIPSSLVLWPYLTGESEVDADQVEMVVSLLLARAEYSERSVRGETMQQVTIPMDTQTLLAQLEKLQSGEFAAPMPTFPTQEIPRPLLDRAESPPPITRPTEEPQRPTQSPPARSPAPTAPPPSSSNRLPVRARALLGSIRSHGDPRSLDRALLFAIIETESAFNPMARSPAPAYGLMQIVPRSAGQDASAVLFGRPRILSPSYLYDPDRNIEIGAIYLDILLNRYLAGIKNPRSRLYCAIAAYNTGAGNVFRAFTGRTKPKAAFREINALSPEDVYRHLIWELPYRETRQYLAKVVERIDDYRP